MLIFALKRNFSAGRAAALLSFRQHNALTYNTSHLKALIMPQWHRLMWQLIQDIKRHSVSTGQWCMKFISCSHTWTDLKALNKYKFWPVTFPL